MTKYIIEGLNGDLEITPTSIKMNGYAGAPINDDISIGGFFVDLYLIVDATPEPIVRFGIRISHDSQPEDTKSLESIKEWAIAQLDAQYGVTE